MRTQRSLKTILTLSCWYSLDSSHWVPGFESFFRGFLHHFVLAISTTSIIRVNPYAAVGYIGHYKMMQKHEKWLKSWHMGTHLTHGYSARAINWISTLQTLDDFQRSVHPCVLGKSSLSSGRVKEILISYRITKIVKVPIPIVQSYLSSLKKYPDHLHDIFFKSIFCQKSLKNQIDVSPSNILWIGS